MPFSAAYRPSRRAAALGDAFYDVVTPAEFPMHVLRYRNRGWARRVGLGALTDAEWIEHMGRLQPLPGSFAAALAFRYHGHQFRAYNPEIGDGRGFLFAQLHDLADGRLLDLGTKGSGRTPWSRFGDGRLTLKGGVREVLATAMLEALGVDTSKSFSLIETGEALERHDEPSPTRASVLVRLSHSHIRIGTFQRLRYFGDDENLLRLLDYVIETYMPHLRRAEVSARAVAFLAEVQRRVARVGAQWMTAGFVHGVLNTDNINVTGESFDYGPWRFAPVLDPAFTAAYFDQNGLYAFCAQPDSLLWNLTRLAECLLPLAPKFVLVRVLEAFQREFRAAFNAELRRRLGVWRATPDRDEALAEAFWRFLHESGMPFEQAFFDWYGGLASAARAESGIAARYYALPAFAPVRAALADFVPVANLRLDHPYFRRETPCTMLIDEVEAIWAPIDADDDWSAFDAKLGDIAAMAEAYGAAVPRP